MAIRWSLAPGKTGWEQYWASQSIAEMVAEARNEKSAVMDAVKKYTDRDSVIIDGGCGLGRWPAYFKEQGYRHIIGLDYLRQPIMKLKQYSPQIDAVVGSVEAIPLKSESIDFYLSGGVIEHFEEGPQQCLAEAYRILKNGGVMLVTVPYQNLYRSTIRRFLVIPLLKLIKPKFRDKNRIFYQYYYHKRDLRRLLFKANLTILDWFYNDRFTIPDQHMGIYLELPFLRKKGGAAWELNRGVFFLRDYPSCSQGEFFLPASLLLRKRPLLTLRRSLTRWLEYQGPLFHLRSGLGYVLQPAEGIPDIRGVTANVNVSTPPVEF